MKTPPIGVSSSGGIAHNAIAVPAVSNPFVTKPAAPLRFLENRDLFFSSSSVRASIDPFLNNARQKTLYLKFERPINPLARLMGQTAHAVVVIEKGASDNQPLEKTGARLSINTAYYTPDDTVLSTLFMPQLETFYQLETARKPSLLQHVLGWFGIAHPAGETRIRLPQAQEGRVLRLDAEKRHTLTPGDKPGRAQIREDVLAAISVLEEQGYQLTGQEAVDVPATKNPFKDVAKAIEPVLST